MTKQHITLYIPGLFDSVAMRPSEIPQLMALETLIARANRCHGSETSYYSCVLEQFDTDIDRDAIPVAAVSRYADGGEKDGYIWMHSDPVYLNADKDRLILQGSEILELDMSEVNTLLQELNTLFADNGWYFEAFHNNRWYVRLPQKPQSDFYHLTHVLGRSVEPFLPRGTDQIDWHRFLNEAQILLHASSVNHLRAQQNKRPINSVWCWAPGKLPEQMRSYWDSVYADEPFVKGLAMLSDTPVHTVPVSIRSILDEWSDADTDHNTLVVIESSEEDILSLDSDHYLEKILMLEQRWFAPLLQAIHDKRLTGISLLTGHGECYQVTKNNLRRFWRKRKRITLNNKTIHAP